VYGPKAIPYGYGAPPAPFLPSVSCWILVLKHRRDDASSKFVNVAVLEGDQVKVLNTDAPKVPGFDETRFDETRLDGTGPVESPNVLVELAVSMRAHNRGGALLVVPSGSETWRVEAVAGLTAVDGATVITRCLEVLAFGVKIRRREGYPSLEQVLLMEPVEGSEPQVLPALQTGGTRHLSAAQFAHDQRDAMALVASQDGRFTVFAWSESDAIVRAHRVETLLL
jgi:hypothetical protein